MVSCVEQAVTIGRRCRCVKLPGVFTLSCGSEITYTQGGHPTLQREVPPSSGDNEGTIRETSGPVHNPKNNYLEGKKYLETGLLQCRE